MKSKLFIVKIGGALIDNTDQLQSFLKAFSDIKYPKILVHGGGKLTDKLAQKLDIPQNMVNGRRITDVQTLDVATMVYAGSINKNIVAQLQGLGNQAMGFCGADANAIKATKRSSAPIDFGFVGDVSKEDINHDLLVKLLSWNIVPIFSSITHDGNGSLLNTNADTIASAIAQSLSITYDVELLYCFDKEGILENIADPTSIIPKLDMDKIEKLKKNAQLSNGILPKIQNAIIAKKNSVKRVFLLNNNKLKTHISTAHEGTEICL